MNEVHHYVTPPGSWKFADRRHTLLVEPETAERLRAAAERALPRETGGLLAGRSLRDDDGRYIVISGFAEARPGSGKRTTFEVPEEELKALCAENARANPGTDEMGWWHSHRDPGGYSPTDYMTQRMFGREDSVGLLVFARGTQWATAYIGPEAAHLGVPHQLIPAPAGPPAPPTARRQVKAPLRPSALIKVIGATSVVTILVIMLVMTL